MKAILFAAILAVASAGPTAANTCVIPSEYTATASTTACTGPNAAFVINGVCLNLDGTVNGAPHPLTTAAESLAKFASTQAALPGCRLAGQDYAFGTNLEAGTGPCTALAAAAPLAAGQLKGIQVTCAANLFPLTGTKTGILPCISQTVVYTQNYLPAVPAATGGFANVFDPTNTNALSLTGANRLQCLAGCTVPSPFCINGAVNAGITITDAAGARVTTITNCQVAPGSTWTAVPSNNAGLAATTLSCSAAGAFTTTGTTNFVPLTGAVSSPWTYGGVTGLPRSFAANTLSAFPAVTSTVAASAAFTTIQGSATQQVVTVTGCPVGTAGNACVQDAIRYWRCRGFQIDSCTRCLNNGVAIACPTQYNGFGSCDDDGSKKGLLGLLGLLGIIPLCLCCLLLCCFLFPCCIRRKKTEGDVHFATFDPHAAPVATAVCAEPVMTHCVDPCAVPTACY